MRASLRVLSLLLAAGLLVLGVLVVVEIVVAALDDPPVALPYTDIASTLRETRWDSTGAFVGFGLTAFVGLLLLWLSVKRGQPSLLPMHTEAPGVSAGTNRRSLQRAITRWAGEVDGVSSARTRLGRRTATVRASSSLHEPAGLDQRVAERVSEQLHRLELTSTPRVNVRMDRRD